MADQVVRPKVIQRWAVVSDQEGWLYFQEYGGGRYKWGAAIGNICTWETEQEARLAAGNSEVKDARPVMVLVVLQT